MIIPLKQIELFIQQLPKTIDWPAEEFQFAIEMASYLYVLHNNKPPRIDDELPIVTFRKNVTGNNWQWWLNGFKINLRILSDLIHQIQSSSNERYVRPDAEITLLPKKDFVLYPNYRRIRMVNQDDDLPHVMYFKRNKNNDDWELREVS